MVGCMLLKPMIQRVRASCFRSHYSMWSRLVRTTVRSDHGVCSRSAESSTHKTASTTVGRARCCAQQQLSTGDNHLELQGVVCPDRLDSGCGRIVLARL